MLIKQLLMVLTLALFLSDIHLAEAGFLDQLLEEGKKKLNETVDKTLQLPPPSSPPGQPERAPQRQGSEKTVRPSSVSKTAELLGDGTIGVPKVRTALNYPIVAVPGQKDLLTEKENIAFRKWVDYFDLSITPDLFERRADCFASLYLPQSEKVKFVETTGPAVAVETELGLKNVLETTGGGLGYKARWKGDNEFERMRSRQAFIEEYRDKFTKANVATPVILIRIVPMTTGPYDFEAKGFRLSALGGLTTTADSIYGLCAGQIAFSPAKYSTADKHFTHSLWQVEPETAEQLYKRLPKYKVSSDRDSGVQLFQATVFELFPIAGTTPNYDAQTYKATSWMVKRPQLRATVKEIGLYEDPDLERPLHKITIASPNQPVMLTGIPDRLPDRDFHLSQPSQTTNTLLVFLKHHGDVIDSKSWDMLVNEQLTNDAKFYSGSFEQTSGSPNAQSFDANYIPFVWSGFVDNKGRYSASENPLDAQQMELFKKWIMKRAESIPATLIVKTHVSKRSHREKTINMSFSGETNDRGGWGERLITLQKQRGVSPPQIIPFNEIHWSNIRQAALIFPQPTSTYVPKLTREQEVLIFGDGSDRASPTPAEGELEVRLTKTDFGDLSEPPHPVKYFTLYIEPVRLRVISYKTRSVLYEEEFSKNPSTDIKP